MHLKYDNIKMWLKWTELEVVRTANIAFALVDGTKAEHYTNELTQFMLRKKWTKQSPKTQNTVALANPLLNITNWKHGIYK